MRLTSLIGLLLVAFTSTTPVSAKSKKNDAVLLSKVRSLTLRNDALTSHRRVKAIPQLKCVGGSAKGLYDVDVMRCTNSGSEYDSEDVQWTCKASLPAEFKLGSTDVICEGYDSPDDPFILKGSCGVEYRLILTDLGEEKHKDRDSQRPWKSRVGEPGSWTDTWGGILFWIAFAAIVLAILYSIIFSPRDRPANRGNGAGQRGWGGGGWGGDDNDPPPPYTPRAPPRPKKTYGSTSRSSTNGQQSQPWRPGFWSGTAAGAAAGYAAGSYANRTTREQARPGPSNWYGGGAQRPSPGSSFGSGSSFASPSSSRHESTGFGGTSRR